MLDAILTAAGVPYQAARWVRGKVPDVTYAVTFDDVEVDGPDYIPTMPGSVPRIYTHTCRIELYEPALDPAAEAAVEAELDAHGVDWTKDAAYWLKDVQRYQVLYEFTYIDKRR